MTRLELQDIGVGALQIAGKRLDGSSCHVVMFQPSESVSSCEGEGCALAQGCALRRNFFQNAFACFDGERPRDNRTGQRDESEDHEDSPEIKVRKHQCD